MVMEQTVQAKWYVVHTLSGQEYRVQERLMNAKRLHADGVEQDILAVEVPTEKVSEMRHRRKTTIVRKFYPGYILVSMRLYEPDGKVNARVWYYVKETQGVIGFIGGDRPLPLSDSEVETIMAQTKQTEEASKPKVDFAVGDVVTIKEGAFENFEGTVQSLDPERGKLGLSVTIFDRPTRVEVEYWQVERSH